MIPIISAITETLGGIFGIVDKLIPDKDKAIQLKHDIQMKILDLQGALQMGQIDINKLEAAHRSIFVAGWRPAIGWICAFALGWHFIGFDLFTWLATLSGSEIVVPKLVGTENLMEMVLAMLGLAGFRTYEKYSGVAK